MSVACPRCGVAIDPGSIVSGMQTCRLCRGRFEAVRFDPPAVDTSVPRLSESGPGGGQPCPAHPGNAASLHCSRCGVFACALCRIETDGKVLCPPCFERLADAGELPSLLATYRDYGRSQALLAMLGLVIPFFGPVAGPASMYYGTKALEQRRRMGEEERRASVWALYALAAAEAVGGLALFAWIAT